MYKRYIDSIIIIIIKYDNDHHLLISPKFGE